MQVNPRKSWILDSTPVDSGFQVLDSSLCQLDLDSGFQGLVGLGCIPNSKAQDSGFHKEKFPRFRIPQAKFSRIPDATSKTFSDSRFQRQTFPGFWNQQAKFSRIPDCTSKTFPDSGFHKQKFHGFRIPLHGANLHIQTRP